MLSLPCTSLHVRYSTEHSPSRVRPWGRVKFVPTHDDPLWLGIEPGFFPLPFSFLLFPRWFGPLLLRLTRVSLPVQLSPPRVHSNPHADTDEACKPPSHLVRTPRAWRHVPEAPSFAFAPTRWNWIRELRPTRQIVLSPLSPARHDPIPSATATYPPESVVEPHVPGHAVDLSSPRLHVWTYLTKPP